MTLTAGERQITDWLAEQRQSMIELLADLVNIDSGSYDKAGVDAVGSRLLAFFAARAMPTTTQPDATYGDAIHVRLDDKPTNERPIVLMGHRDTVFPKGEAGRRPFRVEGNRAFGPGVVDMKGGLVLNAFVLAAFKRFSGNPAPLAALITGDEEIASPSSRPVIEAVGRKARCVFNAEPGRPSGNIVTGRKGGIFIPFAVTGKAAHSGGSFEKGISAIHEIAHKIVALQALTDLERGVTLNVGLVEGGQSVNTTAPAASAELDLRYIDPKDRAATLSAVARIIETSTVPGATATMRIRGEFLPLTQSPAAQALFTAYVDAAAAAGLTVEGEFSGGCADSGFTAGIGCPTICGVGPVGGNAHTAEEYIDLDTLVPRAQALALAIMRMPANVGA